MTAPAEVVFLLHVDDTLLDNDQVERDLRQHLTQAFGAERQARYWEIFEQLRVELDYADYLGALHRYRVEHLRGSHLLQIPLFLLAYPFAECLYPGALDVRARLRAWGPTVILSDGDVVFQSRRIDRSGLWDAVDGHVPIYIHNVPIYIHKEQMLDDVATRYPAQHDVMVDDKLGILAAMKQAWGARLTTVLVRQGHYAPDLKVRVVDMVDLMTPFPPERHPYGMDETAFVDLFTADMPVVFAFHGFQRAIHEIVHGRVNAERFHVRLQRAGDAAAAV